MRSLTKETPNQSKLITARGGFKERLSKLFQSQPLPISTNFSRHFTVNMINSARYMFVCIILCDSRSFVTRTTKGTRLPVFGKPWSKRISKNKFTHNA